MLYIATDKFDIEVVRLLIWYGASIDHFCVDHTDDDHFERCQCPDGMGMSLLARLIYDRVDIHETIPGTGTTALHVASANGDLRLLKWLLSKGASINARDLERMTALHYSILFNVIYW